jgi:hypothetical protein
MSRIELHGNPALQGLALRSAGAASAVALQTALLLRIVACATWAGIAVSVLIWYLTGDALETWCQKSTFRKNPGTTQGYVSEAEELKSLYQALGEVTFSSGAPGSA